MPGTNPENPCHSCVGACCRADAKLTMALDGREVDNLRAVGTVLIEFVPAEEGVDWSDRRWFKQHSPDKRKFLRKASKTLQPGQGIYGLKSDCGFLQETDDGRSICSVHEDPDLKPGVCSEFKPGSRTCVQTREKVIEIMRESDCLLPDLVEAALGEAELQTVSQDY